MDMREFIGVGFCFGFKILLWKLRMLVVFFFFFKKYEIIFFLEEKNK